MFRRTGVSLCLLCASACPVMQRCARELSLPAQDNGFKEGGAVRRIPFEVMVKGDKAPFYEETLEDAGRFTDQPVLPFNAYGTMALARGEFEANSGSSQVFWLLKVGILLSALCGDPD